METIWCVDGKLKNTKNSMETFPLFPVHVRVTVIYSLHFRMNLKRNIPVTNGKELSPAVNKTCLCPELFNGLLEKVRGAEVSRKLTECVGPLFSNSAEKTHLCRTVLY
jgi:hypothetical protein